MKVEKQADGIWVVRTPDGRVAGTLDGRYGEWVARAGALTLGVCRSRQTAEILVRAHASGQKSAKWLNGN
ncbi:hypothetical protein [Niveibacterium sp.]|uniref:hypothetical protein n=1 Tax=Niveibacterium sp. TaxID=2017444 RepID=UPI0035B140DE